MGRVISRLSHNLGLLLFFTMIFSTGANQGIRYLILFGIFCLLTIRAAASEKGLRLQISPEILSFTLFYVTLGLLFVFYGYLAGNPGALVMLQAYVLYPILFALILQFSCNKQFLWNMVNVIVVGAISVSLYGLVIFGVALGILPDYLYFDIGIINTLSTESGSIGIGAETIIPLLFITPFLIALVFLRYLNGEKIVNTALLIVAIILCLVFAVVTGRRSFWAVIAMAPFLTYFFLIFRAHRSGKLLTKLFITISVISFLVLIWQMTRIFVLENFYHDINDRLLSIFNSRFDSSFTHKEMQSIFMLREWSDRPIFGYGHGAVVKNISSSDETPWAYEATYSLLLHNTGVVGFVAYSSGIIWLYIKAIGIIKRSESWSNVMIAILVGLTSFLIANITNPYLGQIDSLWILFYPLAIINTMLLKVDSQLPRHARKIDWSPESVKLRWQA